MSSTQYKTVVRGEASESSSEEEEISSNSEIIAPVSVVVAGEASESDEEELDSTGTRMRTDLPPLTLNGSSETVNDISNVPNLSGRSLGRPKYDTVLNRKLWESNLSLCNNMNGVANQAYLSAAKEITNCGHQLSRSHASIQDVSHNMRLLTNDLLNLDDRIDIITSCKLLPNIQLPESKTSSAEPAGATSPGEPIADTV